MCPFACCAGSGPTLLRTLAIALLAGAVGVAHSMSSPLKLSVEAPDIATVLAAQVDKPGPAKPADPTASTSTDTATANQTAKSDEADKASDAAKSTDNGQAPAPAIQPPPRSTKPPSTAPAKATKPGDPSMLSLENVKTLFDRVNAAGDVSFVDARNPDEFVTGHIPSALNMPPSQFVGGQIPPELQMIPSSNIVVVYCSGGDCDASKLTAIRLGEQGYTKVYVFEGGITEWKAANLPVEKSCP